MDQYSVNMKQELPNKARWLVLALFFFSLLTLLTIAHYPRSGEVIVEAVTAKNEYAQLFWLASGDGYTTENSSRLQLRPGRDSYSFRIKPVNNLEKLRFDPSIKDSRVVIRRLALLWDEETVFDLTGAQLRDALSPVQGVEFKFNSDKNVLAAISTGIDPIIELDAADLSKRYRYVRLLKEILTILPFTILVWGHAPLFQHRFIYQELTRYLPHQEKTLDVLAYGLGRRWRLLFTGNAGAAVCRHPGNSFFRFSRRGWDRPLYFCLLVCHPRDDRRSGREYIALVLVLVCRAGI